MKLFTALFAFVLAAGLIAGNADAARLGGGRSMGIQRMAPIQRSAPSTAPAPSQARPAAPATQPQPGNRWLGPLAGLAAGLGLGWLIGNGGLGGFGGVLMMALLAVIVIGLLSRLFGPRQAPQKPMQYANNWGENQHASGPIYEATPASSAVPVQQANIPADFDAEGFLTHARRNFRQLQDANDRADVQELREVTTPQMFDLLKDDVASRGARQQQTEIVALNAELLEVATEGDMHWVSVRFTGSVREAPSSPPEPLDEVWNLQKPVNGQTGWLLAGIQQTA